MVELPGLCGQFAEAFGARLEHPTQLSCHRLVVQLTMTIHPVVNTCRLGRLSKRILDFLLPQCLSGMPVHSHVVHLFLPRPTNFSQSFE